VLVATASLFGTASFFANKLLFSRAWTSRTKQRAGPEDDEIFRINKLTTVDD